jgi:hypothetical protein
MVFFFSQHDSLPQPPGWFNLDRVMEFITHGRQNGSN